MGILDRLEAKNKVHVINNFFTEQEVAILDEWSETMCSSSELVYGFLSTKNHYIYGNRQSIRPLITKLRESIKNTYGSDLLYVNELSILEISQWQFEVVADPDYVPTEEELAQSDKFKKTVTFGDPETIEYSLANSVPDKNITVDLTDGKVSFDMFKNSILSTEATNPDGTPADFYYASIILGSNFTGGDVSVKDESFNLSSGDVIFFKKSVSERQDIEKILLGKRICINLMLSKNSSYNL